MAPSPFQFPVIGPLISRHAEDAAFYWSQLDRACTSPQVGFQRIEHFNRLQDAHMDGLTVAGIAGWQPAFHALERWQKAGEAFVCMRLAAQYDDCEKCANVLAVVGRKPDELLRGVISALVSLQDRAVPVIRRWSEPKAEPAAQVAALRAAALMGNTVVQVLSGPLALYFSSASPHVRSAACRASAVVDQASAVPLVSLALNDAELPVRAEAAIAMAKLGHAQAALPTLQACVIAQSFVQGAATGWYRTQATRRLNRWAMALARIAFASTTAAHDVLAALPPRIALTFILAHGNLAHLPFVVEQMTNAEVNRYAGWVWQTLTGIDLAAAGWTMPEPDSSTLATSPPITESRLDADNGLPQPNHRAVLAFTKTSTQLVSHEKRILMGRELDIEHALNLLETAPQALRVLAAQMLNGAQLAVKINVRASATEQRFAMNLVHDIVAEGVAA